jgi:hypothetical protein
VTQGELEGFGYRVEVSDAGLFSRLEIATPHEFLYRGQEPRQRLTRIGSLLVMVGPALLVTVTLALLLPRWSVAPLLLMAAALALTLFMLILVLRSWRTRLDPLTRAIDHAWTLLVPQLRARGLAKAESAFLAGLAAVSAGQGDVAGRTQVLEQMRDEVEHAARSGGAEFAHAAALWRLCIEDCAAVGADPVPLLVAQVGRCFDGAMSLSFAEPLLSRLNSPWWTEGQRGRLRVLLAARAFEAGLEVSDLLELGRLSPALGEALATGDADGLARLRLLWSLRSHRGGSMPWERCGPAATVFEVAAAPESGAPLLEKYPDLLLVLRESRPIYLCGRGLEFEGTWFAQLPRSVEVLSPRPDLEGGYQLVIAGQRFEFGAENPDALAARLERWFRYFFRDFVPQVASVSGWRSAAGARRVRQSNAVVCPECNRELVPLVGQVGLKTEEGGGRGERGG